MLKRKCYLVGIIDEEFYVIYGSRYMKVVCGEALHDHIKWDALENQVKADRNEGSKAMSTNWWNLLDYKFEIFQMEIFALYNDGKNEELKEILPDKY